MRCVLVFQVPDESPTFNFTGPSEMLLGSSAVYRVDMYMPYPSTTLVSTIVRSTLNSSARINEFRGFISKSEISFRFIMKFYTQYITFIS